MIEEPLNMLGLRIVESPYLVVDGPPHEVPRTWKERLLERPWHPLRRTRLVTTKVPYRGVIQLDAHTVVVHPQMLHLLREQLGHEVRR